jgi:hypothetical protein
MNYKEIDSFMHQSGLANEPAFDELFIMTADMPKEKKSRILGLYYPEGDASGQFGHLPPGTTVLPPDVSPDTLLHELGHRYGHYYYGDISEEFAEEYRMAHEREIGAVAMRKSSPVALHGARKSDIDRVANHYNIGINAAENLLNQFTVDELLPPIGTGPRSVAQTSVSLQIVISPTYTGSVLPTPYGDHIGIGKLSYPQGTSVELFAFPLLAGAIFDHWEGDVTGTQNPITVIMSSDKLANPVFVVPQGIDTVQLTTGTTGNGVVEPSSGTVNTGAEIILAAAPGNGYIFDRWSGDIDGTTPVNAPPGYAYLSVIMDRNRHIVGNFKIGTRPTEFKEPALGAPASKMTLHVGNKVRINLTVQHRGPAIDGAIWTAIGRQGIGFAEDFTSRTPVHFNDDQNFTTYGFSMDVVIDNRVGTDYDMRAKIMEVPGDDIYTPVYHDVFDVVAAVTPPGEIPAGYELVDSEEYPANATYTGNAERAIASFKFLPDEFPGAEWFVDRFIAKHIKDEIEKQGEKPLTYKLYNKGFDYKMVIETTLTQHAPSGSVAFGPLVWVAIIGAITLASLITIYFLTIEVVDFVKTAPAKAAATIAGVGLILLGVGALTVVGIAAYKGTPVKKVITG